MRKKRSKVEFVVPVRNSKKTDTAKWRDTTIISLSHAQARIKSLCEAFIAGHITRHELEQELPPVLDLRDREKRRNAT